MYFCLTRTQYFYHLEFIFVLFANIKYGLDIDK